MAIQVNLAMTGAEFGSSSPLSPHIAWMACHFSPSHGGLSNLPRSLPAGTVLILNDRMPFSGHDQDVIGDELLRCIRELSCAALLLDFQRPEVPEVEALTRHLVGLLPCTVAVTPFYAVGNNAAVFLPPLPCHVPLKDWVSPWQGRDLWLELALDREVITLTPKGASKDLGDFEPETGFEDKKLHCRYRAAVEEDHAIFKLWRTREDLEALLQEAETLGISRAVGLYQELGNLNSWSTR